MTQRFRVFCLLSLHSSYLSISKAMYSFPLATMTLCTVILKTLRSKKSGYFFSNTSSTGLIGLSRSLSLLDNPNSILISSFRFFGILRSGGRSSKRAFSYLLYSWFLNLLPCQTEFTLIALILILIGIIIPFPPFHVLTPA